MITISLLEISKALNGQLLGNDTNITSVFTDSRAKEKLNGSLFIALKGPRFDAHKFIEELSSENIAGVIVEHDCGVKIPQIIVKNTRIALAQLARLNRNKSKAQYIAITGSSGKTTVKEMIASILKLSGETLFTQGNFNNDIGAPLTLLNVSKETDFAVIELGASHAGDVAYTAEITQPKVALVNNIAAAHLQGFGDIQGVARAKSEIYESLSSDGIAILNADDDFYSYFDRKITVNKITFSISEKANVYASEIKVDSKQSISFHLNYQTKMAEINLPLIGLHNVANALAAASCCLAIGISLQQIKKGLSLTPEVTGRLIVNHLTNGCCVIDDTYNANVASMKAAIDVLKGYPKTTILVCGDMGELGDLARQCHEDIGEYAQMSGITKLYSCGVLSKFSKIAFNKSKYRNQHHAVKAEDKMMHYSNKNELIKKLKSEAVDGVTILIKGSRSAHMEKIVEALVVFENEENSDKHNKNASIIGIQ